MHSQAAMALAQLAHSSLMTTLIACAPYALPGGDGARTARP